MKKTIFAIAIVSSMFLLALPTSSHAQTYESGDKNLNLGLGLGGGLGLPISASFDFLSFSDAISAGIYVGYASTKTATFGGDIKYTYIIAGVRSAYHFDIDVENLDLYAGVLLGYNKASVSYSNSSIPVVGAAGGVAWSVFGGARYYLTDNVAAFAELGYGISYGNIGVSFKF